MKLKKYVKLKKEQQVAQFTEAEETLFNSGLNRVEQNAAACVPIKRRVNIWKILTPVISAVGVIAITLTCVFTLRNSNDFLYNDENVKSEKSTFEYMQNDVKYFDLGVIKPTVSQVLMSFDSKSNDKLFYSISANMDLSAIKLDIVINAKYNHKFNLKTEPLYKELSNYTVNYNSEYLSGDPQANYRGWIKVQTEIVYFDYVQIPALGDDAFFETIQQIVKVKN